MLTTFIALAAAAAPASAHQQAVEQAIYDICPRAIAGTLAFEDAAQVAAAGYQPAPARDTPSGAMPQIGRGEGTERILISARRQDGSATCAVWFGGPENRALLRAVRARARSAGYRGGSPVRLGDNTPIQLLRQRRGGRLSMTIIEGNAGGDLTFEPVTTVITMTSAD
jgi:hypothetical protein